MKPIQILVATTTILAFHPLCAHVSSLFACLNHWQPHAHAGVLQLVHYTGPLLFQCHDVVQSFRKVGLVPGCGTNDLCRIAVEYARILDSVGWPTSLEALFVW
jgi:hypothetical protein